MSYKNKLLEQYTVGKYKLTLLELSPDWLPWQYQVNVMVNGHLQSQSNFETERKARECYDRDIKTYSESVAAI